MSDILEGPWRGDEPRGARALTVSQLNAMARGAIEEALGDVLLTGEISGYRSYPSGCGIL